MQQFKKRNPKRNLNKLPVPDYKKRYDIYNKYTGLKKNFQLQQKMPYSCGLMVLALVTAGMVLIWQNYFSSLELIGLFTVVILSAFGAYLARDKWIAENLNFSSHTEWLENQKVKAYGVVKNKCGFKQVDIEDTLSKTFKKTESFLENRLNIFIVSIVVPVWSIFLSNLQTNHLTLVLASFIFIGSIVVYFNYMFFILSNSNKSQYRRWIESCKDLEEE